MWFNGLRCCDCSNLDLDDRNKYGDAYCPVYRKYVELDSYTCRSFAPNFYVVRAYCDIVNLDYRSDLPTVLINFRDNYMIHNKEGKEFLEEYEVIGPILAEKLRKDMYRTDIADNIGESYLEPMVDFIYSKRYDEAQSTFINMIDSLKIRYGYLPINNSKTKRL